jgi:hypothetical protein
MVWITATTAPNSCYDDRMKERLVQIRIYEKEHGILRRLAVRKSIGRTKVTTVADVVRQLVKEA